MFCSQCGAQLRNGARFCSQCGVEVRTPQQASSTQETASTTDAASQTDAAFSQQEVILVPAGNTHTDSSSSGAPPGNTQSAGNQQTAGDGQPFLYGPATIRPPMPPSASGVPFMKWYKTLIWVVLPLAIPLGIINAVICFTGSHYLGVANLVYAAHDLLRLTDFGVGLAYLYVAAMALFVRQKLTQFKKTAPGAFISFLGIQTACSIYSTVMPNLVLAGTWGLTGFTAVLGCIAYYLLNAFYFRRRAHLFVNPD